MTDKGLAGTTGSTATRPKLPGGRWRRRLGRALVVVLALWVVLIGPWPADNRAPWGRPYAQRTAERLAGMKVTTGLDVAATEPLRVGVGEVEITPEAGRAMAGYSLRLGRGAKGVDTPLWARAMTIERGGARVTILTVDLLLVDRDVAEAVLRETGLAAEEVYFTASHTHSGPGEWGKHPLQWLVAGWYDEGYTKQLVGQLAEAVRASREEMAEVESALVTVEVEGLQRNRLVKGGVTFDRVSGVVFRKAGSEQPWVILTSFSAHATVVGPRDGDLWSADYPGGLVAKLKELTGAEHVLFAAGAVGDVQPTAPAGKDTYERAREMGARLAEVLAGGVKGARYERSPAVSVMRLPVDLPGARIAAGAAWQWAPWGARFVTDRVTHLHALRIGESLWVGFPVDYTGSLARDLSERVRGLGLTLTPTSFNGDYKGYFVRREEYMSLDHYETRMLGFFGPWGGEYVNALAEGMARRMVGERVTYPPEAYPPAEPGAETVGDGFGGER